VNDTAWLKDMAHMARTAGLGTIAQVKRYHLAPCTGLHCTRPECRKRRKERLRKEWEGRDRRRCGLMPSPPFMANVCKYIFHESITLQDDRWRREVEERAR